MSTREERGLKRLAAAVARQQRYVDARARFEASGTSMAYMELWAARKALEAHNELPPEVPNGHGHRA